MKIIKKILTDTLGEPQSNILAKAIFKQRSRSVVDPSEQLLGLLTAPRAIISWLITNVKPMKVGEHKELKFPGRDDITIHIEKQDVDVYRADFIQNGTVIHRFNQQSLPAMASHMVTTGELYEDFLNDSNYFNRPRTSNQENDSKPDTQTNNTQEPLTSNAPFDMLRAILQYNDFPSLIDRGARRMWEHANVKELTNLIGKLIDIVANLKLQPHINESNESNESNKSSESSDSAVIAEKAEMPAGAGIPRAPIMPQPPKPPTASNQKMLNLAAQQARQSGLGRISRQQLTPPKLNIPKLSTTPKMPTMKEELDGMDPNIKKLRLLRNKVLSNKIRKNARTATVSSLELFTPCEHCGVPLFKMNENQFPVFTPCVCFRSEHSKKRPFVKIQKNEDGNFKLIFNPHADPQSVYAFLLLLKTGLLSQKILYGHEQ